LRKREVTTRGGTKRLKCSTSADRIEQERKKNVSPARIASKKKGTLKEGPPSPTASGNPARSEREKKNNPAKEKRLQERRKQQRKQKVKKNGIASSGHPKDEKKVPARGKRRKTAPPQIRKKYKSFRLKREIGEKKASGF